MFKAYIIRLKNNTDPVDVGFSLGEDIIAAQRELGGQQEAKYEVTPNPKYYVALFTDVKKGDLVSSEAANAPIMVEFKDGNTHAKVTAYIDAGNTETTVDYSP